ncbi:MAG: DUF1232 domain-containing protein [Anaerolineales bacterium]|nr:DUF1232 domain-containing protein [Anaerolineales bacterium]
MTNWKNVWRERAQQLKIELYALYLAYKDPRVPWYARVVVALVVGYAFSPIDLIPDPIPIIGYLDDLLLLPLGVMLAIKLIPADVMHESRAQAHTMMEQAKPTSWWAAIIIAAIWLALIALAARFVFLKMASS